MSRTLVVYFSRTGHTKLAAERIAGAMKADVDAITGDTYRGGVFGYLRCAYEARYETDAAIELPHFDSADFDLVIVGTPVWDSAVSSPVRSYLRCEGARIKALAVFCTEGERGGYRALKQMSLLANKVAIGELVLRDSELASRTGAAKIHAFAEGLDRHGQRWGLGRAL